MSDEQATSTGAAKRKGLGPCAVMSMLFVGLVVGTTIGVTVIGLRQCGAATDTLTTRLTDMMKPKIQVSNVLDGTIRNVQRKSKLEVMQAGITAEVAKSEKYEKWGVYWGTTNARVRARDCKVQYVVPLEKFSHDNIKVDPVKKTVTVTVPEPVPNEEIVEVNYESIEVLDSSSGWARFNKKDVEERAKAMLRQAALEQARSPLVRDAACENARKALRAFLDPLAESLQPDVHLEIEFAPRGSGIR